MNKNSTFETLQIADIIIPPERIRVDLGDMEGLTASVEEFGLEQPIVTDEKTLVAGYYQKKAGLFDLRFTASEDREGESTQSCEQDLFP